MKIGGKKLRCYNFTNWRTALILLITVMCTAIGFAGTTGKVSGKITDSETGEPILGANILIADTYLGAAADIEGDYYINNIPPGTYNLKVTAVGYQSVTVQNVIVKIDLTTRIDVKLTSTAISIGSDVVITAQRPLVQKDLTSSSVTISSNDIKMMPVENVNQVINLQAGVVDGHFRGGRSGEVAYLVDGVSVTDPFNGGFGIQVENSSVREMEVISGTFNAEYGQAMSGVVNIVTQDGASKFTVNGSAYTGSFLTSHTDVFQNLTKIDPSRIKDFQLSLSGPTYIAEGLSYFVTGRYLYEDGYLYGKRVYNITDGAPIVIDNANGIFINRNTGDGKYVAMNPYEKYSLNGKISYVLKDWKFSYSVFYDHNRNKYYDHGYSWAPDGVYTHYRNSIMHNFQISYVFSQSTYSTLKFSRNEYYYKGYLYEDPYDSRYIEPGFGDPLSDYTFRYGGNYTSRYNRFSFSNVVQWQLNSQVSKQHKLGIGAEARYHRIYNHYMDIHDLDENDSVFTISYRTLGSEDNQEYLKKPVEISAYVQDKMEYDIMIINAGVRFDYFDPRSYMPSDLKNPQNNTDFPGAFVYKKASRKTQLSPRLGVSFPITDQGIIHFSYGHFFQIPSFENLYINSDYLVTESSGLSNYTGNPDLDAQRTVMYELGLQQVLFANFKIDVSAYYRDIRNLLGMEIINTYQGTKYARYINRDYGNVRGFIVTLEKRFADYFGAKLDYTYQIAEGNASDPMSVYNNNQSDPPVESNKTVVPLNWDQRHTLNLSVNIGVPGDWTAGFIFSYGSGLPYTESIRVSKGVQFENGGRMPATYNVDFRADKAFEIGPLHLSAFVLVYNLLDIKNEVSVNNASGRANVDLYTDEAGTIFGLNTIKQYLNNPSSFSAPRQVRLGVSLGLY